MFRARPMLLAAALLVAACQPEDPFAWGTVVGVEEVEPAVTVDEPATSYENLNIPEVGWRVEVQLDDGPELSVTQKGGRRLQRGDRVRLLHDAEHALLL